MTIFLKHKQDLPEKSIRIDEENVQTFMQLRDFVTSHNLQAFIAIKTSSSYVCQFTYYWD